MNIFVRKWRRWNHGRHFAKIGKNCDFPKIMEVKGNVYCGDSCRFRNNVVLRTRSKGKIVFADRSGASFNCVIEARELVQIGSFSGIAENVVIRDTDHLVVGTAEHWRLTPHITAPVIIGESCLIGSGCYIGPGVTIGDGAVITQGSIVTRDIGPLEIWGGSPARKIMHRTENVPERILKRNLELLKQYGLRADRVANMPAVLLKDSHSPDRDEA